MQPTAAGISALLVIMFLDKLNSDCVIRCLCTKLELKLLARLRELFSFWKPIPILQFFGGFVPWQVTKAQPPGLHHGLPYWIYPDLAIIPSEDLECDLSFS